eukprot:Awhi_evm1s14534
MKDLHLRRLELTIVCVLSEHIFSTISGQDTRVMIFYEATEAEETSEKPSVISNPSIPSTIVDFIVKSSTIFCWWRGGGGRIARGVELSFDMTNAQFII